MAISETQLTKLLKIIRLGMKAAPEFCDVLFCVRVSSLITTLKEIKRGRGTVISSIQAFSVNTNRECLLSYTQDND